MVFSLNGFSSLSRKAACCDSKYNKRSSVFHNLHLPRIVYQPAISALEKVDLFIPRWGRHAGTGAAGAGQNYPSDNHADHPQH
jgi:hypothetical protein